MNREKRVVPNRNGASQTFDVKVYDDHIVITEYLSDELSTVDIPSETDGKPVTEIDGDSFFNHKEITDLTFLDTLKRIDNSAFAMCKGIKELILPDSITEIEGYAFRDCRGLRKIVLPAELKVLKHGVFAFCYLPDDVEIILNEGLETIESGVFYSGGLNHFLKIKLPNSVKIVAEDAFDPGVVIEKH